MNPHKRANVSTSVLKTVEGKFLMLQTINDTLTLCAEDVQNEDKKAPLVDIVTQDLKTAYKFHYKKSFYWVKADAGKLECVEADKSGSEPMWFERENQGSEQYSLRFMHQSTCLYIATQRSADREILTVTENSQDCLIVTHEKRE